MKTFVFGAGSIGGHFSARLAEGGGDVSVIASEGHSGPFRWDGIVVSSDCETTAHVVAENLGKFVRQDAVIEAVKVSVTSSVASTIAPPMRPSELCPERAYERSAASSTHHRPGLSQQTNLEIT